MKKLKRALRLLIGIGLVAALSGYGIYKIPTTYTCYPDQLPESSAFFTFETKDQRQDEDSYTAKIKLFGLLPIKDATIREISQKQLIALGSPFGIKLYTKGVIVVDTEKESPGVEAGIEVGDIILSYNGVEVRSNEALREQVQLSEGKPQKAEILRNRRKSTVYVTPALQEGEYTVGLWVRDSTAGIGTLTYYDPQTNRVAGLGHSISDVDTGLTMPVESGTMVDARITGIKPGEKGDPGELLGALEKDAFATVDTNCQAGLFGTADTPFEGVAYPIALRDEIQEGEAQILCTLEGDTPKSYTISITRINNNLSEYKNLSLQVTDPDLLAATGGIVQGMSGSPIIQNGKLIGAVTHVLVDDPTKGYAIFVENMLETAQSVAEQQLKEVS